MSVFSWRESIEGVLNGILCSLKSPEGDVVLGMTRCPREGRTGCCLGLSFKIMASTVTVKQNCRYGEREAGAVTGKSIPGRGTAV